ncbi:MAG TPA: hypothetical protein HA343_07610 [Methanomassiliicoccales archaeon]|nr:hypothetical protein [Methanomassiliicoccales archaeon]
MVEKRRKRPISETEELVYEQDKEPEDIYDDETRQEMLEDDEITAAEEGFMRGWEGTVEGGKKHEKDSSHKDTASVALVKEQYQED